jgi:hypothetical protein
MRSVSISKKYLGTFRSSRQLLVTRENRWMEKHEVVALLIQTGIANFDALTEEVPAVREEIDTHTNTTLNCTYPSHLQLRVLADQLSKSHDRNVSTMETMHALIRLAVAQPDLI